MFTNVNKPSYVCIWLELSSGKRLYIFVCFEKTLNERQHRSLDFQK